MTRSLLAVTCAWASLGCGDGDVPRRFAAPPGAASAPVEVRVPARLTSIQTGDLDALGRPVRVACATCHSLKRDATVPEKTTDLGEVHAGLSFDHGDVPCASCHAARAGEQPWLHLADGRLLPTSEAKQLCAQCHGPQARDWAAGAHGGMDGHWDLSRGGRTRNHCVDCHDPHVPAFQAVMPAARARDRMPLPLPRGEHR